MATSIDFIEFVCEQLSDFRNIRYRKMFGEYVVYLNNRPIFLVCDNTVFVKRINALENIIENNYVGYPYKGAKEHYILDIENRKLVEEVVPILESLIPVVIPKKKKIVRK